MDGGAVEKRWRHTGLLRHGTQKILENISANCMTFDILVFGAINVQDLIKLILSKYLHNNSVLFTLHSTWISHHLPSTPIQSSK
jgi:hypothetical protein